MYQLAKSVWFKDDNGKTYQLGNKADIQNCVCAWAKDSNGNIYILKDNSNHQMNITGGLSDSSYRGKKATWKLINEHEILVDIYVSYHTGGSIRGSDFFKISSDNIAKINSIERTNMSEFLINNIYENGSMPSFYNDNSYIGMYVESGNDYNNYDASYDFDVQLKLNVDFK